MVYQAVNRESEEDLIPPCPTAGLVFHPWSMQVFYKYLRVMQFRFPYIYLQFQGFPLPTTVSFQKEIAEDEVLQDLVKALGFDIEAHWDYILFLIGM